MTKPIRTKKLGLAVLISGGGSNLQAILDACERPDFPAQVHVVISNIDGAKGLERARQSGIPAKTIPHNDFTSRGEFEDALQNELSCYDIDLICLAGFMRILTPGFIEKWPRKIINTHPSLLPKFGGEGMFGPHVHRAVIEAQESESGSTIHYVIPEVDKGAVILQKKIKLQQGETPETLAARVLEQEHMAYPEAIKMLAQQSKKD